MEAKEKTSPGLKKDSESEQNNQQQEQPEQDKSVDLATLQETIQTQTETMAVQANALLALNKRLQAMEKHQDQTDTAIIEVAKKVGEIGGGGGSGIIAQLAPLLASRGPGPLEKIAMKSFLENMAFSTLTTRRIARKQFGDEYTKMVSEMEADMAGQKGGAE